MISSNMPVPAAAPPLPQTGSPEALQVRVAEAPNERQNMRAEQMFRGGVQAKTKQEGLAITLGRKHFQEKVQTPADELLKQAPGWQDYTATYAALSQIQPGDSFQNGIPLEFQGTRYTITHVDPEPDADGHIRLRMGTSSACLFLDEVMADATAEGLKSIETLPPDQQASPDVLLAKATFEGAELTPQQLKEVAKSMGFVTTDSIVDIARGMKRDGKPLLSDDDMKILSGEPVAEGATPLTASPKAEELQKIFAGDQVLSEGQIKAALFALEIPTDGTQLRDLTATYQKEYDSLKVQLDKFTHNGEAAQLAKLKAMQDRLAWLEPTIKTYEKVQLELTNQTGSDKFDVVKEFYATIQDGLGDEVYLEKFINAVINPTTENIAAFDKSFDLRKGQHQKLESKKKAQEFFRKFIMYGSLGGAGLIGFNIWRAAKKNEEGSGQR